MAACGSAISRRLCVTMVGDTEWVEGLQKSRIIKGRTVLLRSRMQVIKFGGGKRFSGKNKRHRNRLHYEGNWVQEGEGRKKRLGEKNPLMKNQNFGTHDENERVSDAARQRAYKRAGTSLGCGRPNFRYVEFGMCPAS